MNDNRIGKFIQILRKEKNLTQQELGEKLFITDKAISKWERGLSLPDLTTLKKLSELLEVDISEILEGKRGKNLINIEEVLKEENKKLKEKYKRRLIKVLIPIITILLILIIYFFKNIYLGYNITEVNFKNSPATRKIKIGFPKNSFMLKNNDRSFSVKSFRSKIVLEKEIKDYLKTLKYLNCNETIYYYDEKQNFSIIDYKIDNKLLYSTVSYELTDEDFCYLEKIRNYNDIFELGKGYSNGFKLDFTDETIGKFYIEIVPFGYSDNHQFIFHLRAVIIGEKILYVIEDSKGTYEIKDDKLIYYRDKINLSKKDFNIPKVSTFTIKDKTLILDDNYLKEYESNIIININEPC